MLQDSSGGRHNLVLGTGSTSDSRCVSRIPQRLGGGDVFYGATLSQNFLTINVSDLDGTTYRFPGPWHGIPGTSASYSLPSFIEDRNGNKITVTDSGAGAFNVTDTLGRAAVSSSGFGTTGNTLSVSGLAQPYTVNWGTANSNFTLGYSTAFPSQPCINGINGFPSHDSETQSVITAIQLPNGKQYQFTYDPTYGELNKITYPWGGYVSYGWGLNPQSAHLHVLAANGGPPCYGDYNDIYDKPAILHRYVSFDGVNVALQQDFQYAPTTWSSDPNHFGTWTGSKQTTVTTYDCARNNFVCSSAPKSTTVYTYGYTAAQTEPFDSNDVDTQLQVEQTIAYKDANANTLRTVTKGWFSPFALACELRTLDSGQISGAFYTYGAGEVMTDKKEYDYGQITNTGVCQNFSAAPTGITPTRETAATYQTFANTPIYPEGPSIFDRLSSAITYGNGVRIAETDYSYDQTSVSTVSPTAIRHDETLYGPGSIAPRGNLTTATRKCLQTCADTVTKYTYDETGQVLTMIDPCGNTACSDMNGTNHTTAYLYADSYTVLSGGVNVNYTPSANTNAFLTQITDALSHTQNFKYDFNNGQLTSSKDPNLLSTAYIYNDSLARPTQTNSPDGGQTTVAYNDTAPSPTVTTSKKINSTQTLTTVGVLDGIGHVVQSKLCEDGPTCAQPIKTDSAYDGLGRVRTKSKPHRTATSSTDGTTTFYYDALGRTCLVVPPDGTLPTGNVCPTTSPANDVFTTYSGNTTTVTDQAGKSRKSVSDGLGRLSQVFEDPGSTPHLNYETDYTYDALGNLLTVNQKGGDANSANWRTRTFAYNSLSRLTSSINPESNTQPVTPFAIVPTAYVYDANGNLSTKTSPAPNQTSTAIVTTTFTYDVLNRLTQKSFSDSTPTLKYGYDAVAPAGCTLPILTIGNGIGKRTGMCDAAGAEAWSYDITAGTGWKITDARTTNSATKSTIVQNNLAGSAATLTYPSGRIITYAFDAAARPLSAIDSTGPINYATAAAYAPTGALSSLTNGASVISTLYFNNRLQPCRISVKNTGTAPSTCADAITGNVLDFTYNFSVGTADNGNVTAITNNRDTTRSQSFVYDSLNRISTAKTTSTSGTTCWDEAFGYDPWGNLLTIGRITGFTCSNEELLNTAATPQNRISGDTYDSAGNLTAIPAIATYTYNAENQLTATAGVTYIYDGDGKRVQKSSGKLYWYGMGSDPLDETDLAGNTNNASFNEYTFFGGKRIARRDSTNAVNYFFADHLGTARIVANSSGAVCSDADFYPFGGERSITSTCSQNYKFTGKERDSESGLDNFGARYDSSSIGRFMSPDSPSYSNHKNPQSWNLYAYSLNNPVTFRDADGHKIDCVNNTQQCQADAAAAAGNAEAASRVTTQTTTTEHKFLFFHWTTTETQVAITGDINTFRALSPNAAKLADLVTSKDTISVSYDQYAKPSFWAGGVKLNGGSTSYTPSQGYGAQAFIDPSRTPSVVYDQDAVDQRIPQANTGEEFGHEVLGHIWGELFGGAPAGTRANMRDSIVGENAVRALDPTRGQKGLESHHNYNEMPPDPPKP